MIPACARALPAVFLALACVLSAPIEAFGGGDSVRELMSAYEATVPRPSERSEAGYDAQAQALDDIAARKSENGRQALKLLLIKYGSGDVRQAALILGALVRHGDPASVRMAIEWVEDRHDPILMDLLHTVLAKIETPASVRYLREQVLRAGSPAVKVQVLRSFAVRGDKSVLPLLMAMTRDGTDDVRIEAIESLGLLGERKARPVVQVFLRDPAVDLRTAAARALGRLADPASIPALVRALDDENPRVSESAAVALGRIDDPRAVPALIAGLAKAAGQNLRLADAFTQALQRISGKAIHDDPELWQAWWATVKDRKPFPKGDERPGTKSVPGPRYFDFPVRSSRVVFVLDVSRSMGWNERLDTAKKELLQVIEKLPKTTYFNVIVFSQQAWSWKSRLQKATKKNVNNARRWIRMQKPLLGTNTYGALKSAFADADVDTVFLLSDGHPSEGRITDPQLILGAVRSWNRMRDVRIHGIALLRGPAPKAYASLEDQDRSLWFMQRLCEQNNGRFREVK